MEEKRMVNGLPIESDAHILTFSEDTLMEHIELSKDMWDGEEDFYIDFFTKFLKTTTSNFGDYAIAKAFIKKGIDMLREIEALPTYNYEELEKLEEEFTSLLNETRKKDPYK